MFVELAWGIVAPGVTDEGGQRVAAAARTVAMCVPCPG